MTPAVLLFPECGRSVIHDLQSEVSGDYGKALLILAEVLEPPVTFCDRQEAKIATQNRIQRPRWDVDFKGQ